MTAVSVRSAHTTPADRLLVQLGLALVRLGRARAQRRVALLRAERAWAAAERRRAADERAISLTLGPRR